MWVLSVRHVDLLGLVLTLILIDIDDMMKLLLIYYACILYSI